MKKGVSTRSRPSTADRVACVAKVGIFEWNSRSQLLPRHITAAHRPFRWSAGILAGQCLIVISNGRHYDHRNLGSRDSSVVPSTVCIAVSDQMITTFFHRAKRGQRGRVTVSVLAFSCLWQESDLFSFLYRTNRGAKPHGAAHERHSHLLAPAFAAGNIIRIPPSIDLPI